MSKDWNAEARSEFVQAYDLLMRSRDVNDKIQKLATDRLAHAQPIMALIQLKKIAADGATIRNIEIDILRVTSDRDTSKSCLNSAEKNAVECSSILSRLEVYSQTETDDKEIKKWQEEFRTSLWHLTASIEEIRALHAQIKGSGATLEKRLSRLL